MGETLFGFPVYVTTTVPDDGVYFAGNGAPERVVVSHATLQKLREQMSESLDAALYKSWASAPQPKPGRRGIALGGL